MISISSFYSWLLYCFCCLIRIRHCWRKCVESAILKGWITSKLNFRLVTVRAEVYGPLYRGMIVLRLYCWEFSVKETLYQTSFNWSWVLFKKKKSSLFEPHFGRLRGNVRTSSIARWKDRIRLPVRYNGTFFASSYCWDVTGGNLSTWAIFEGEWIISPILGGRGRRPPTTVG